MNRITQIIQEYREGTLSLGDAETTMIDDVPAEDMAEFIMDAFARGWITPFNLGIQ